MESAVKVRQIEVSADGSCVCLLFPDRLVVLDVGSGRERTIVSGLAGDEVDFVVSLDGRCVSLRRGERLKIWDTSTGSLVRLWTSDGSIYDAGPRMMPDGRLILDPRGDGVYLFDIATAELRMHLPTPWRPWRIQMSPDGRLVEAITDRYGDAWLESDVRQCARWDTTTGEPATYSRWHDPWWYDPLLRWVHGHGTASACAFTPDHSGMVVGFPDGLVGIRNPKIRWLTGHSAAVTAVAVSPDGQTIVSASLDGTVHVCRPKTGAGFAATFQWACAPIVNCVIRPDGKTLVAVDETGSVYTLRDWLSAPVQPLPHAKALTPIEWILAPEGSRLFLLYPGWLVMHNVDSGTEQTIVQGLWGDEEALVTSGDGLRVGLRCGGELRIWDVDSGLLLRAWPTGLGQSARMTPDGRGILDRPRGTCRGLGLFDVDTGKVKVTLSEETLAEPVQVSADGRWVAAATPAGSGHRQFAVWDTTTGKTVDFVGGTPASGQFRGHWFAGMGVGASVWDLSTGARVFHRQDYKRPFTALAVMPDDHGMVVGFEDGRLGIWDLTGESKVRRLPGHKAGIRAIAAAPDGRAIVSASSDGVVQVCATKSGTLTATYCAPGPIRDCVIRPDGNAVVAVEDNRRVHVLRNLLSASVPK